MTISEEERKRILDQAWSEEELGGLPPILSSGLLRKRHRLNSRPDGSCVFLSEQGRCRIHEKFGYDAKPLPCRLFPFVLVPAGDHWRVGLRFACPSAASSKGRALPEHHEALLSFAEQLARREKLQPRPDGSLTAPPRLEGQRRLTWPEVHQVVDALVGLVRNRRDPVERRLRKCLAFLRELRRARLADIEGPAFRELLTLLAAAADADTPALPHSVAAPGWVGRVLFRQAVALFTRKDHGPHQGTGRRSRLALMAAAWRFVRGKGPVPRLHARLPESTFEELELPRGPLPPEAEEALERYYTIKVGSLQFCGPASFGMSLGEGLEALALTLPVILYVARMWRDRPREEALLTALSVVDDHVGFNKVLGTFRQRLAFHILARGDLPRLIAWYSR